MKHYRDCVTRLESRGDKPPTREYVDRHVAGMIDSGLEACWHSAVNGFGSPLFPSKVLPADPSADMAAFEYMIRRFHEAGRPVLSWHPLYVCASLVREHPDWRMQFLKADPNAAAGVDAHACCYNSPYGELFPKFAAEVVRDVGFDGLWIDGSTMSYHGQWPMFAPGCVCAFCRERFLRETGLCLPSAIDFENRTFRVWVNWRYDILMEMWRRVTEAVKAVRPDAVVCFNNYRRRGVGVMAWNTAIPLRRIGIDATMSCELDGFPGQADFQIKQNRAYACGGGVETWFPMTHYWQTWTPDMEVGPAIHAMTGALAAGGPMACGGSEFPAHNRAMAELQKAGSALHPYRDGNPVAYAATWCSQSTQDFFYKTDPQKGYDQMHGAHELCLQAHVPSAIVFDDHVAEGDLSNYPVLLMPNVACVSARQAGQLQAYVENGGILMATCESATHDELGYPHATPVCDALFGIEKRLGFASRMTHEFMDRSLRKAIGQWFTMDGWFLNAEPAADVEILAVSAERGTVDWNVPLAKRRDAMRPAIWRRKVGRGWVVFCCLDLFLTSLHRPMLRASALLRGLLLPLAQPWVYAEAPACVTLNARTLPDGRMAVILHNAPGSTFRYPNPPFNNHLEHPGTQLEARDIRLVFNGLKVRRATSGITGKTFPLTAAGHVRVSRVSRVEVVLVE